MATILIIEDDEHKANALLELVTGCFPCTHVDIEKSLQTGLQHLLKAAPDLLLLDMSIPTYEAGPLEPGGPPLMFGGEDLLGQMDRFDLGTPVIVVTQFDTFGTPPNTRTLDEVDAGLRREYPALYRGHVYYHATLAGWREQLCERMREIIGA